MNGGFSDLVLSFTVLYYCMVDTGFSGEDGRFFISCNC